MSTAGSRDGGHIMCSVTALHCCLPNETPMTSTQVTTNIRNFRLLAVTMVGLLAGCPGGDDDPDANLNVRVELGTGTVDFEPLAADQDLELIAGPQGGHHFIVHARMQGMIPGDPAMPGLIGNPATSFRVFDEGDNQIDVMFPPYKLGYAPSESDPGWLVLPSGRILQVEESLALGLYGTRVRIDVRITDATTASGLDERWVTVIEGELADGDGGVPRDAGPADAGVSTDAVP